MIALLLLACRDEPEKEGSTYIDPADEVALPALSTEEVQAALDEALVAIRGLDAGPVLDAYEAAMDESDGDCPTYYSTSDGDYWYDSCDSDDGARFDGYLASTTYDGSVGADGVAWTGFVIQGVAAIETADGRRFVANGGAGRLSAEQDGLNQFYTVVDGDFSWDGDEAEGTWLADGPMPAFTLYAWDAPGVGARAMVLQGSASGFTGEVETVVFDGVALATESAGFPCEIEPSGTLSFRDADGSWVDLLWDMPYDTTTSTLGEMDEADCDGCASTWAEGEYIGQTCLDWSGLLDWDGDAPWG